MYNKYVYSKQDACLKIRSIIDINSSRRDKSINHIHIFDKNDVKLSLILINFNKLSLLKFSAK